jgi:hypothetical protein
MGHLLFPFDTFVYKVSELCQIRNCRKNLTHKKMIFLRHYTPNDFIFWQSPPAISPLKSGDCSPHWRTAHTCSGGQRQEVSGNRPCNGIMRIAESPRNVI